MINLDEYDTVIFIAKTQPEKWGKGRYLSENERRSISGNGRTILSSDASFNWTQQGWKGYPKPLKVPDVNDTLLDLWI